MNCMIKLKILNLGYALTDEDDIPVMDNSEFCIQLGQHNYKTY